jgi:hypothetical protein
VIALATATFMEHEIIFHAFCPFHHLLLGVWDFISLKDEFANPRLQAMENAILHKYSTFIGTRSIMH